MKKFAGVLFATTFLSLAAFGGTSEASELDSALKGDKKVSYLQKEEVILANTFSYDTTEEISENKEKLKSEIADFSDDEFDRFIFNIVRNNSDDLETVEILN